MEYGKQINGFQVIRSWHLRYLLCFFAAALVVVFSVTAAATAVTKSFEVGLSVGSYALGLAAILIAILTLLSATVLK